MVWGWRVVEWWLMFMSFVGLGDFGFGRGGDHTLGHEACRVQQN